VAPARSSLASERRNPSTPFRVAASSGESASEASRATVTTRPFGASRRSTDPVASTVSATSEGRDASVSTTTTAPHRASSVGSRRTSRSQPSSVWASASASGLDAPSDSTSTGPTVSGSPGLCRRSTAGRGRPSFLARVLVRPVLTSRV
jgi:hypothetical protein